MTVENPKSVLHAAEIDEQADSFSHPWNPNSFVTGTRMSHLAGLKRVGVSKVMVPVGKEYFIYHSHQCETSGSTFFRAEVSPGSMNRNTKCRPGPEHQPARARHD